MFKLRLYAVSREFLNLSGEGYIVGIFKRGFLFRLGSDFASILFSVELAHPFSAVIKKGAIIFPVFQGMRVKLQKGAISFDNLTLEYRYDFIWDPRLLPLSRDALLRLKKAISSVGALPDSLEEWCCCCQESLAQRKENLFLEKALSKIGYGEGSTPLADDVIGGMALGLFLSRKNELLNSMRKKLLNLRNKTSEYSFKMILLLSSGVVPWSLKSFLKEPSERKIKRVLSLGSSSGFGILRGVKAVLNQIEVLGEVDKA